MINFSLAWERVRNDQCPLCGSDDIKDRGAGMSKKCRSCGGFWGDIKLQTGIYCQESPGAGMVEFRDDVSEVKNSPALLCAILKHKKVLPALIGIDEGFDKLIEEKLRNG